MARGLNDLATSMRQRADDLPVLANELTKEGAKAALRDAVMVTPVDTSEAISGWQVGIGSRPNAILPPHVPGRKGSTRGASAARSISEGEALIDTKPPGGTMWLSNTAKHIVDLDAGSSAQFAGGFLPRAIIAFRLGAKEALKRLLK